MTIDIIIKYLHFLGIIGVISALFYENIEVKPILSRSKIALLAKIDGLYGLGTIVVLATGFSMWFWIGKPAEFYSGNMIFYSKIAIFTVIGLLSAYPTIFFIKNQKGNPDDIVHVPGIISTLLKLELALIILIPLLATTMARGIGIHDL